MTLPRLNVSGASSVSSTLFQIIRVLPKLVQHQDWYIVYVSHPGPTAHDGSFGKVVTQLPQM